MRNLLIASTLAAAAAIVGVGAPAAQAEAKAVPLVRYFDGLKHYVTSGARPGPKYREEGRVPILSRKEPGTRAIYGCLAGNATRDQFLTGAADCENSVNPSAKRHIKLRTEGYLFTSPGPNRRALYRCYVPHTQSHFVSLKSDCESNPPTSKVNKEFVLGYFPS
ncbi:hypothetical protein E1292_24405 [Nonomuraea deserti]|uniref:Subtilisin inhibitor domain-containing protein n=1 Tax=Nonomuraea deserti TaxID=1848322 RepID=A0A4R4VH65_9ACTN|nr:hypothetical protein [Nonomuraea deserti]TDD02053.1 hypothetical protein E1292_24405 [Nonomuraea deserti]